MWNYAHTVTQVYVRASVYVLCVCMSLAKRISQMDGWNIARGTVSIITVIVTSVSLGLGNTVHVELHCSA